MIAKTRKKICLALLVAVLLLCINFTFGFKGLGNVFFVKNKKPIYSVDRQEKKIAISFDCAWGVDYTNTLLEIMEKYKIKSTFFMVEFWAQKNPDYVAKISQMGHEIGTHSSSHKYMSKLTKESIVKELTSSCKTIQDITGKKVELFRPPYGDYNNNLLETASSLNLKTIQWSVDSLDWKDYSADKISERIITRVKSGDIILCHNNALHIAEALPKIFEVLISQGYVFVPIGELVYNSNYHVDVNGIQRLN